MIKQRIPLSTPTMNGNELDFVKEAFDTNWIAPLGPHVDAFENSMAKYVGMGHAAALSSGTAAIHMALKAIGVKQGDIVFCSSLTFAATCNPIMYQYATPVFIDSEPETWNMSIVALRRAFKEYPNPKALIAVNLYGTPARLDEIAEICEEHGVPMIEDAAESLGSTYKGQKTGSFGRFGIFSFNGNKIITTSGGGMLIADDEAAISKVRFWSTQARDPARHYQHSELGYNYRMSNVCAGIGRGQLLTLDDRIMQKTAIYDEYKSAFADISEIQMNPIAENSVVNHWLSCMELSADSRVKPLDIMIALEQENIESRPIWKPMNLQPYYEKYDFFSHNDNGISVGEDIFNRGLCMPSDVKMTEDDVFAVIQVVKALFA